MSVVPSRGVATTMDQLMNLRFERGDTHPARTDYLLKNLSFR